MIRAKSFYDWAWDPVEGCLHDCWYCYARKEVTRNKGNFEPQFFEDRLMEPFEVNPSHIFVNHLADIMGAWVPDEWIQKVIDVCFLLPEHTFLWMTKNPRRYYDFHFPANCVLGVTLEGPDKWERAKIMEPLMDRKMASCEPLLGSFKGYDFSQFEYVVAGGIIGKGRSRYLNSIKHSKIYKKKR